MNVSRSPRAKRPQPASPVHSITAAAQAHSADLDARIRRYLISMAIRTVCFILVLVIDSPIRWAFAVLAVILPYVAVVMANAAGGRRRAATATVPTVRIPLADGAPADSPASAPFGTPAGTPAAKSGPESDLRSDASSERTN